MKKIINISILLMRLKKREPLDFVWNLFLPLLSFVFIFYESKGDINDQDTFLIKIIPFISWIIFQTSVYGVGMTLISWRESGMLRSFIFNDFQKLNLIISLIVVQIFYTSFFLIGISLTGMLLFNLYLSIATLITLLASTIFFTFLYSGLSLALNSFSYGHNNLSSLLSILILPLAWTSHKGLNHIYQYINIINPMYYFNSVTLFLTKTSSSDGIIMALPFLLIALLITFFSYKNFNIISKVIR